MQHLLELPATIEQDLEKFKEETARFKDGSLSAADFRSFRVPYGIYEQREDGLFMLRLRLPAGGMLPHQMRTLAQLARSYGRNSLHVTTRQGMQLHCVPLEHIHQALVELSQSGISTRGGGGNTVRNITACDQSGVCDQEIFDVAPYAVALTEFLLQDPLSYQLPRKYKIAFSGCKKDCALATVNDLGFVAQQCDGDVGFAVYVGGGMGARSRVADVLEEFVPATQIHLVAEAVKHIFDTYGNRQNRNKARLRFLVEQVGLASFREMVKEKLAELRDAEVPCLALRDFPSRCPREDVAGKFPDAGKGFRGFAEWRVKNVAPQKQKGFHLIRLPLSLGDIAADTLEKLAQVAEQHGDGIVRTTQSQNLDLRWVAEEELTEVHSALVRMGMDAAPAPILSNILACAGASTCRLGICLSRGLALAITDALGRSGLPLETLNGLKIHISGCPNACGRHPVGDIGLFGVARRMEGRLVPCYMVQVGGGVVDGITKFAQGKEALPARNIPDFVVDYIRAFLESPQHPDYPAFLAAQQHEIVPQLLMRHKHVPSFAEDQAYFCDWGAKTPFSLNEQIAGECSAAKSG